MTPLNKSTAAELAGRITASRPAFARIFDAHAMQLDGDYLDFKLVALGAGSDRAAFQAALIRASESNFLSALVKALVGADGLNVRGYELAEDGSLVLSPTLHLKPQDGAAFGFTPQGWHKDMINLISVDRMLPAFVTASRRVCSVVVDNQRLGTGFLVGPQTVLTNWHVVHSLIDDTGQQIKGSDAKLQCSFDYLDGMSSILYAATPDWLVDWSPMAVGQGIGVAGSFPDQTSLKAHALDFCVVRLRGAPGRSRGWYDLSKPGAVGGSNRPFFVVQHPDQLAQQVGVAREANLVGYWIEHLALTLGGSSGGLCLNEKFELAGLHQGQVTKLVDGAHELVTNRAIPAGSIGAICATKAASVLPAYDAIWITRRNRLAVVGRGGTLGSIAALSDPNTTTPILVVRGPLGAGKRFTAELIEDRVSFADFWIARLDADNLPASARDVADLILQLAGVEKSVRDGLSVPADAGTTDIAWIREPLFREFRQAVDGAANGRLLWIVLQNLDRIDIVPSAARRFLDVLYEQVPSAKGLRVVLLGLDVVPTGDPQAVLYEDLPHPDNLVVSEIEDFVAFMYAERGVAVTAQEIKRLANLMHAASEGWPASAPGRLGKLGNLLSKVVYPESKKWVP